MKNLKNGESITSQFGDVWNSAIMVVDRIQLNFRTQILRFSVEIYKDAAARTDGRESMSTEHIIGKDEFLANFDPSQPATSLNSQCEDYALTLLGGDDGETPIYGQFE